MAVLISYAPTSLKVQAPFHKSWNEEARALGATWDPYGKAWYFSNSTKHALWSSLRRCFKGEYLAVENRAPIVIS